MCMNTESEVTSQNLWSKYDRHFVGITWHIMCGVKGRRFIVLFGYKLNQFGLRKCPHSQWLTNKAYKQYHSNKNLSAFYLQNGGENGGHR